MRDLPSLAQSAQRFLRGGSEWIRRGRPLRMIHFGNTPGDDLLCTVVARELRRRGGLPVAIMSDNPDLFRGNPDVATVIPVSGALFGAIRSLGGGAVKVSYPATISDSDGAIAPTIHIAAHLCEAAGITGLVELLPRITLSERELGYGRSAAQRITIMSAGSSRIPIPNKEWGPEKFQSVVDALRHRFEFVQIGSERDPRLEGTIDLRGKTSLRQAAATIANSTVFVGIVGFLMHLARAVDRRSVIVYGGREAPWQSGYTGNINLTGEVPCAPCWYLSKCGFGHRCMTEISVESVVSAVLQAAVRIGEAMPIDRQTIAPAGSSE